MLDTARNKNHLVTRQYLNHGYDTGCGDGFEFSSPATNTRKASTATLGSALIPGRGREGPLRGLSATRTPSPGTAARCG